MVLKTPSLYQLYAGGGIGNAALFAEKSVNYEIGLQHIQHKKINNRLVFFYRDIKDGIDYRNPNPGITSGYFNFIQQVVKGIEYEWVFQPTTKLSVTGNYTFLASEENTKAVLTLRIVPINIYYKAQNY